MAIKRKYGVSDNYMLEHNRTMLAHFIDEQATFAGFDADFANPFEVNWEGIINAAATQPTDETVKDQLEQLTANVEEAMQKCRDKFQRSKYFVEKAFPDKPAVRNEFGFDDYDAIRKSQTGMLQFMQTFFATATKYAAELDAAGYDAAAVADIDTKRIDLDKANTAQEKFKGTRLVTTEDRIIAMNKAWDTMLQVSKAGKSIFSANQAKYQWFLLPATSESGSDISIAGTVTATDGTPIQGAEIAIAALSLTATTDSNGKYVFALLPEGSYTLDVTAAGYQPLTLSGISVTEDQTTTANVQLSPI